MKPTLSAVLNKFMWTFKLFLQTPKRMPMYNTNAVEHKLILSTNRRAEKDEKSKEKCSAYRLREHPDQNTAPVQHIAALYSSEASVMALPLPSLLCRSGKAAPVGCAAQHCSHVQSSRCGNGSNNSGTLKTRLVRTVVFWFEASSSSCQVSEEHI